MSHGEGPAGCLESKFIRVSGMVQNQDGIVHLNRNGAHLIARGVAISGFHVTTAANLGEALVS